MRKLKSNFNENAFPNIAGGNARLAYLSPEVEVQHVELENAIASSIAGSGGSNPNVDDWNPVISDPGAGDHGDLSL